MNQHTVHFDLGVTESTEAVVRHVVSRVLNAAVTAGSITGFSIAGVEWARHGEYVVTGCVDAAAETRRIAEDEVEALIKRASRREPITCIYECHTVHPDDLVRDDELVAPGVAP